MAFVVAISALLLGVLGGFGGLSYAANNVQAAAKAVTQVATSNNSSNQTAAKAPAAPAPTSAQSQYPNKTTLCHVTGSKTNPYVTLSVASSAVPAHLAHGDTLGACPPGGKK